MNQKNGSEHRMVRQFLHELSHIIITLELSGTRELGDRGQNIKIPIWMDEALAEYIASIVQKNKSKIENAKEYYKNNMGKIDLNTGFNSYLKNQISKYNEYEYGLGKLVCEIQNQELQDHDIANLIKKFKKESSN